MKEFVCTKCGREFDHRQGLHAHMHKKVPCVSPNVQIDQTKLSFFEQKVKTLKQQNAELKNKNEELKKIVDKIQGPQTVSVMNNCVVNQNVVNQNVVNQNIVNQHILNQNNLNKNNKFELYLAPQNEERFDHISNKEVCRLLDDGDFSNVLGGFAELVYFNPKAPENRRWCINDKDAHFGALEYNHKTNTVQHAVPLDVISKNLQSLIFGMSDRVEELRDAKSFNVQQDLNYSRFYNLIGTDDFRIDYINKIKDMAYAGRNGTKSLWEDLGLSLENTQTILRKHRKKITVLPIDCVN